MHTRFAASCVLVLATTWAHAATDYDRIQAGDVLEGSIGMGLMARDLPLPPGRWQVLQAQEESVALTPRNPSAQSLGSTLPMYAFTLRNTDTDSLMPALLLRFSPRASNVDWINTACVTNDPARELVDTLGIASPQATLFGCARAVSLPGLRNTIKTATAANTPWVYENLRLFAPYVDRLPDQVVVVNAYANQYRGRSYAYTFLVRQEGSLLAPAYAHHIRNWMNTTGQALLDIARNNKTVLPLPTAYTPGSNDADLAAAAPAAPAPLPTRIPLDKIDISDYFDRDPLAVDTVALALRRCIAQMPANLPALHDGSLFNTTAQTVTFFVPPQSNYFLVKPGDYSTCIQGSAAGYPILPGAAIHNVMEIQGVPASVARAWYRRLALNLALHGNTTVAFTRPDGSATIARMVVTTGSPLAIRHVHYERTAGNWEDLELEDQFSHPAYSGLRSATPAGRGEVYTPVKL